MSVRRSVLLLGLSHPRVPVFVLQMQLCPLYNANTLCRRTSTLDINIFKPGIEARKFLNPLMLNDDYSGHTAPLTSKRCILYIYSTNIGTEYFKHGIYSLFFSLQNAVCFIILTYLVPIFFTFYIQGVLKLKKNNSGAKRLSCARLQLEG